MDVVIDSNILFSDFYLKGANLENLCKSKLLIDGEIYVPEVVIQETITNFQSQIKETRQSVEKNISKFNKIGYKWKFDNPITEKFIDDRISEYERVLRRQIDDLGIKVLNIPVIPIEKMIEHDLAGKKPFKKEGAGYRDYLIWHGVKECCNKPKKVLEVLKVVFITKNTKDFCENDNVHPDLINDLNNSRINPQSVRIVGEISDVINEYITPKQKVLNDIKDTLNTHKEYKKINLKNEVDNVLSKSLLWHELSDESPFDQVYESPTVSGYDILVFEVTDVRKLSEDQIVIDVDVTVDGEFSVFIFKSDYWTMREDEQPTLINDDWNDHYVAALDNAQVNLTLTLIVDKGFKKIQSSDITINAPEE